jgi:hypothetical protein
VVTLEEVQDLRERLLVMEQFWQPQKRRQIAGLLKEGRVILGRWMSECEETVFEVRPWPPEAHFKVEALREIFPSLNSERAPTESSFQITSTHDRVLFEMLERME